MRDDSFLYMWLLIIWIVLIVLCLFIHVHTFKLLHLISVSSWYIVPSSMHLDVLYFVCVNCIWKNLIPQVLSTHISIHMFSTILHNNSDIKKYFLYIPPKISLFQYWWYTSISRCWIYFVRYLSDFIYY
jgi:hypothetical protein